MNSIQTLTCDTGPSYRSIVILPPLMLCSRPPQTHWWWPEECSTCEVAMVTHGRNMNYTEIAMHCIQAIKFFTFPYFFSIFPSPSPFLLFPPIVRWGGSRGLRWSCQWGLICPCCRPLPQARVALPLTRSIKYPPNMQVYYRKNMASNRSAVTAGSAGEGY